MYKFKQDLAMAYFDGCSKKTASRRADEHELHIPDVRLRYGTSWTCSLVWDHMRAGLHGAHTAEFQMGSGTHGL